MKQKYQDALAAVLGVVLLGAAIGAAWLVHQFLVKEVRPFADPMSMFLTLEWIAVILLLSAVAHSHVAGFVRLIMQQPKVRRNNSDLMGWKALAYVMLTLGGSVTIVAATQKTCGPLAVVAPAGLPPVGGQQAPASAPAHQP
jgi:hypothetical protein